MKFVLGIIVAGFMFTAAPARAQYVVIQYHTQFEHTTIWLYPGVHMPRKIIKTNGAPTSPPSYSQGVVAAGLVFVSGQGPFDPISGEVVGTTIQEQTAQCLRNVSAILEASGSSIGKVVSATFILAEETDFTGMNKEWVKRFSLDPPSPQRAKLPIRPSAMKVSIAAIAEA